MAAPVSKLHKFAENFHLYPKAEIISEQHYSEIELTQKKGAQKYVQFTKRYLLGSTGDKYDTPDLSNRELYLILLRLNLNHVILMGYINLCLKFGGLLVFCIYAVCSYLISPSISNLYIFIGSYSERTFLNVWEMVPIFKGLHYISIINVLIRTSREAVFGGLYIRLLFLSFKEAPWGMCNDLSCKWKSSGTCTRTNNNRPIKVLNVGLFKYISEEVLQSNNPKSQIIWQWSLYVLLFGILWTIILILKFKHYKFLVLKLFPGYTTIYTAIVTAAISLYYTNPSATVIHSKLENISSISIWLHVMSVVMQEDLPSHWVTVGCFAKNSVDIEQHAWFIHGFNVMVKLAIMVFLPFLIGGIQKIYSITDHNCITFNGVHAFATVFPQLIYYFTTYRVLVIAYFLALALWSLNVIVLNIELLNMAIVHTFPKMYKYRNLNAILLSATVAIIAAILARTDISFLDYYVGWDMMFVTKHLTFLLIVIIISTYTLRRLNGDYYFKYGVDYPYMEKTMIMMYTLSWTFIMFVIEMIKDIKTDMELDCYYKLIGFLLFIPTIITMVFSVKKHGRKNISRPLSNWGPRQEEKRHNRRLLNIRQMFKYRTKVPCKHNCLLGEDLTKSETTPNILLAKSASEFGTKTGLLQRGRLHTLSNHSLPT